MTLSWSKAHEESLGYKGNTPVALLKTGAWIDGLIKGKDKEENTCRSNSATTTVLTLPEKKRTTNMGLSWSRAHEESLGHKGNTPVALLKTGAWLDGLFQDGKESSAITTNSIPTRYRSDRVHTRWIQENPATILGKVVVSKAQRDEELEDDDDSVQTSTTRTTNTGTIDTMASNVPDSRDDDHDDDVCDEVDPIIIIGNNANDDAPMIELTTTTTTTTATTTTTTTSTPGTKVNSFPMTLSTTRRRFHPFQRIREWKSLVANRKNILPCPSKEEPTPEQVPRDDRKAYGAAPPPGISADASRNLPNVNTSQDEADEDDCIDNILSNVVEPDTYLCTLVGFLAQDIDEVDLLPCGAGRRNDTTSFDELTLITGQSSTGITRSSTSSSSSSSSNNMDESTLLSAT